MNSLKIPGTASCVASAGLGLKGSVADNVDYPLLPATSNPTQFVEVRSVNSTYTRAKPYSPPDSIRSISGC